MAKKLSVPKDFQVGDIVLVESSGARFRKSAKWQNNWTRSMEQAVGKCFTVMRENNGNGVGLAFKDAIWGFPEKSLRLIKRGKNTYFREGDKVLVARRSEEFFGWNGDGLMDGTLGKVYEVANIDGQTHDFRPALRIDTETGLWFYGTDCLELYTGQTPDEQPQPQPIVTFSITEPLQDWERF